MKSKQIYKLLLVMPSIGFYTFSVYGVDGVEVMLLIYEYLKIITKSLSCFLIYI